MNLSVFSPPFLFLYSLLLFLFLLLRLSLIIILPLFSFPQRSPSPHPTSFSSLLLLFFFSLYFMFSSLSFILLLFFFFLFPVLPPSTSLSWPVLLRVQDPICLEGVGVRKQFCISIRQSKSVSCTVCTIQETETIVQCSAVGRKCQELANTACEL